VPVIVHHEYAPLLRHPLHAPPHAPELREALPDRTEAQSQVEGDRHDRQGVDDVMPSEERELELAEPLAAVVTVIERAAVSGSHVLRAEIRVLGESVGDEGPLDFREYIRDDGIVDAENRVAVEGHVVDVA